MSISGPSRIYLDNNATTLVDPRVIQAMVQELQQPPSNPSSVHAEGRQARSRLNAARELIAEYFSVKPQEVIFTSGGTEGVALFLQGFASQNPQRHLITSDLEHACVFKTAQYLAQKGLSTTILSPKFQGACSADQVAEAITPQTGLIFLAAVNSETGVKTDISSIARLAEAKNIPLVIDGVALLGKEQFSLEGIAGAVFSAHKFHGPKGIGFCILKKSLKLPSFLMGGGQEQQMRAGTENLAGIIGLAEAIKILKQELPSATVRMQRLRDLLETSLISAIPGIGINGTYPRICNVVNMSFADQEGELLLALLDRHGVSVSLGSACASGSLEPSRILLNMGVSPSLASASLRFSLSRFTTESEVLQTIQIIKNIIL